MKKILILLIGIALIAPEIQAQKNDCKKFHLYSDCNVNPGPRFKYDGQSRSNIIGVGDQLIYSLILYGEKQYKLNFCTSEFFAPIHVKLINAETNELMYDNESDEYLESLTLNIDKTQRIKVAVEVLASNMSEEDKLEYFGCLGLMVNSKKVKTED